MKTVIQGPKQVHATLTETAHRAGYLASLRKRDVKPWLYLGAPVPTFFTEGRHALRCPNCGAGVSVSMEWRLALCRECGAEYTASTMILPSEEVFAELEDVLGVRPVKNRAWIPWLPGESPADHAAENVKRGYPERLSKIRHVSSAEELPEVIQPEEPAVEPDAPVDEPAEPVDEPVLEPSDEPVPDPVETALEPTPPDDEKERE